jgi:Gpi18-like mannosyltransferase
MWQFKFLILLFDILIAFILYRELKSGSMAPASAALFLFNPAILFCGVLWGQIDNIYVAFIVFSLLCIFRAKVILAGIFFSLACMTKLQTIIYVPLMFAVLFSTCHFRQILKFLAAFVSMAVLFYLPFILTGKLLVALKLFTGAASRYPVYSMNAFNLWWLLGIGNGSIPDASSVLPFLSAKTAGLVLFSAGYLLGVFSLLSRFSRQNVFLIFGFVSMAFFMLPTQMHERYLLPFFVFILFVPLTAKRDRILYDGLSITFFVNLLAVFMIHKRYTNFISTHFLFVSVLLSLFHLAAFIYLSTRVLKGTRFSSFWNFCRERLLK